MTASGLERVRAGVLASRSVLLVPRLGMGGDGLGCLVALHAALEKLGREPVAWWPEPVPRCFRSVPGLERLTWEPPRRTFDLMVTLEAPDSASLPQGLEWHRLAHRAVSLGRHRDNRCPDLLRRETVEARDDFRPTVPASPTEECWVEPSAAALGEMVYDLLEALEVALDRTMAIALYAAILSETVSFQGRGVTAQTHERVARLLEHGVPTDVLGRQILREEPFAVLKLYGRVLSRLRLEELGRLAWSEIRLEELREAGLQGDSVRQFVKRIDQVRGSEVVALFVEQGPARTTVGLRSRRLPVDLVAARFGGGGHVLEAGCLLETPLEEARTVVLEEVKRRLRALPLAVAAPSVPCHTRQGSPP